MVIVDSSVLIDFLADRHNEQTYWLNLHIGFEPIGSTSLILSEVLQGIRSDKRFAETVDALSQFAVFETGRTELAIAARWPTGPCGWPPVGSSAGGARPTG